MAFARRARLWYTLHELVSVMGDWLRLWPPENAYYLGALPLCHALLDHGFGRPSDRRLWLREQFDYLVLQDGLHQGQHFSL